MTPATLSIEGDSHAWVLVRAYAKARIEILTAQCVAVNASPDAREDAAARIDELQQLLNAPDAARRQTPNNPSTGSY